MDKEKMNKAAYTYANTQAIVSPLREVDFKNGANWLMQQPLSERLTEAEKDRIRGLLNHVGENAHDSEARAMRDELETIFGADLFKDK